MVAGLRLFLLFADDMRQNIIIRAFGALLLALVVGSAPCARAAEGLGTSLSDAVKQDLFTFFRLSEISRKKLPTGALVTFQTSKKSAFYPLIRLDIAIDAKDRITRVALHLDRKFVDSGQNGVFARDIAKSTLRFALPAADADRVGALIRAISPPRRLKRMPPGYRVFVGRANRHVESLSRSTIRLENTGLGDGRWLVIEIAAGGGGAKSKAQPLSEAAYLALFLTEAELPKGMRRVQDSRKKGADPQDSAYRKHGGQSAGMSIWMGRSDDPVWRMVDIRWVFPSESAARAYHAEALSANSERQPRIPKAEHVGTECGVFGGTVTHEAAKVTMTHYFYIFRVGRVVSKLYVAQGPSASKGALTVTAVAALAGKIATRSVRLSADAH